jgi:hypothetical protein
MASVAEPPDVLGLLPIKKDLLNVREHVLQIEAFLIYILVCNVALFLAAQSSRRMLVWATAIVSLVCVGQVMRLRNSPSRIRARLINITQSAGAGAGLGIAVDSAFGGLTLGAAAALGAIVFGVVGALAPVPDGVDKDWLDRGQAFKELYKYREKVPNLANPEFIEEALDGLPSFEFTTGNKSYHIDTLKKFVRVNRKR